MPKRPASAASAAADDADAEDVGTGDAAAPTKFGRPDEHLLSHEWPALPPASVKALNALAPEKREEMRNACVRYCILRGAGSVIADSDVKTAVCDAVAPGSKIPGRAALYDAREKMKGLFGLDLLPAWGYVRYSNVDASDAKEAGRFTAEMSKYFVLRLPVSADRDEDVEALNRVILPREHAKRGLLMAVLCLIILTPEVKQVREDELFRHITSLQLMHDYDDDETPSQLRDWRSTLAELVAGKYLERASVVEEEEGAAGAAPAAEPASSAGGSTKFEYHIGPRARMIVGPVLPLVLSLMIVNMPKGLPDDASAIEAALGNESAGIIPLVQRLKADGR